jgi:hypothetical protein
MKITKESLTEEYLDFRNNYLTVEKFAEHRGLHPEEAKALLETLKIIASSNHPES